MRVPVSLVAASALVLAGFGVAAAGQALTDDPTAIQAASTSSDDAPGDISGPCDEAEHAGELRCADSPAAVPATSSTTTAAPATGDDALRSLDAAGAGTVAYRIDGTTLTLLAAAPNDGWRAEIEQASGRELEVDFRAGSVRVQVNVEFEDGGVRERIRTRDDSTDLRTETQTSPAATLDDDDGEMDRDDRVESGDDRSVEGSDDGAEDRSGTDRGSDDDTDDHSGSGHDGSDDDSSGHGGND